MHILRNTYQPTQVLVVWNKFEKASHLAGLNPSCGAGGNSDGIDGLTNKRGSVASKAASKTALEAEFRFFTIR